VVDPTSARAQHDIVRRIVGFAPTHVVHFAVYEPHARANPRAAHRRTMAFTDALRDACDAGAGRDLRRLVVRSGIEVYGRQRGAALSPDELVVPEPTTGYGRTLLEVEHRTVAIGAAHGCAVTRLRCAPVAGPHIPSPLTRYLRLPLLVPVGALPDPPFSLLHLDDLATATVAALTGHDRAARDVAVNVVGEGAVTASQAVRLGGRNPVPTIGPGWLFARLAAGALGSPLPEHVIELFTRGRTADGAHARAVLGVAPTHTTREIVEDMYHWPSVTWLDVGAEAAA
jgi:UDP-glucose 4-epimerase